MLSTNQTKLNQYYLIDLLCLTVLLGLFYSIWIGSHALFTPDEGRYSEVAREMIAGNDFITPRLNGVAFLDKPVLYYWLQASAIKVFGLKEWSLRFWPTFMGILGCLITYMAGALLFSRRSGILSALILATCPLYYGAAHYANLDLEVAVLISNSLMFFIMATQLTAKKRSACFMTAYFFAGLAFLTKGLIGIVFPILVIGSWILILNRWALLKKMHLILGFALFALITTPWYVLAQKANPEFLHFFFVTQQVSRFLTKGDFNNKAAVWFYIPIVLAGIFPWTIFAIQALVQQIKKVWKNRQEHSASLFLLLWFFIVFMFFSIPKSKTVGYILPLFPAVALLMGNYLDSLWNNAKSKSILAGMLGFMIICGIISIIFFKSPSISAFSDNKALAPYLFVAAILFLSAGIMSFFLIHSENLKKIFSCIFIVACLFLLIITASAPAINHRSIKPLTLELKSMLKPEDELVTYYKFYYDLPLYTERRVTIVADWDAPDIAQNDNWLRELWFGMPFQNTKEWLINKDTFVQRWNSKKRLFVVTDMNYYSHLKTNIKHIHEISRYKNTVVISNR